MVELVETTVDSAVISTGSMTVLVVKSKPFEIKVTARQENKTDFL